MQHNKELTAKAQNLRKNMTKEERRLWYEYLHNYPYRFRRQVTCGHFILDFYCASAKLAIELDGSQHYMPEGQDYDARRTAYLEGLGIQVLRFSNTDVLQNLRGVCQTIDLPLRREYDRRPLSTSLMLGHLPQRGRLPLPSAFGCHLPQRGRHYY